MSKKIVQCFLLVLWVLLAPTAHAAMVNINKADAAALIENLEGIGPKKAAAIVAYRKSNGAYRSVDDLLNVKGIGEKILKKNRRDLSLNKGAVKALGKVKTTAKASTAKKSSSVKKASASKTKKKAKSTTSASSKSAKKTTSSKKKPVKKKSSTESASTKKK